MGKEELEIPEGSLNHIKGKISESFIIFKLTNEGYKVRKTVKKGIKIVEGKITAPFIYLNKKGIVDILKEYNGDKETFKQLLKENLIGLPDFICIKQGTISFVEVKTHISSLTEQQEKVIDLLKSKGFCVDVRRVKVDLSISETN